jgi:hypothetical protein
LTTASQQIEWAIGALHQPLMAHRDISRPSEFRRYPGMADIDQAAPIRLDP